MAGFFLPKAITIYPRPQARPPAGHPACRARLQGLALQDIKPYRRGACRGGPP